MVFVPEVLSVKVWEGLSVGDETLEVKSGERAPLVKFVTDPLPPPLGEE
jgi:hypothetical protein